MYNFHLECLLTTCHGKQVKTKTTAPIRSARNELRGESRLCLFTFSVSYSPFPRQNGSTRHLAHGFENFPSTNISRQLTFQNLTRNVFLTKRHLPGPMEFVAVHSQHCSALLVCVCHKFVHIGSSSPATPMLHGSNRCSPERGSK